jgi:hypothetical protein
MKLLSMKFSLLPCYLVPLRPKYSSQQSLLNTLSLVPHMQVKIKLHPSFDNVRYFDCAAALICSTSGISTAVEML